MDLKAEILKYLTDTGTKTYKLEDAVGVPRATIYRYLGGERDLLLSTALRIREYIEQNA